MVDGVNLGSQVRLGGDTKADGRRICLTLAAEGKRLTTLSAGENRPWVDMAIDCGPYGPKKIKKKQKLVRALQLIHIIEM